MKNHSLRHLFSNFQKVAYPPTSCCWHLGAVNLWIQRDRCQMTMHVDPRWSKASEGPRTCSEARAVPWGLLDEVSVRSPESGFSWARERADPPQKERKGVSERTETRPLGRNVRTHTWCVSGADEWSHVGSVKFET